MKICECEAQLADNADRCPRCGARFTVSVNWSNMLLITIILIGITTYLAWAVTQ